jgi:hypothetical protein
MIIYSWDIKEKTATSSVTIMIREDWERWTISHTWNSDRITHLKLRNGRSHLNIIGVYAPVEGHRPGHLSFIMNYKISQTHVKKQIIL